MKGLAELSKPLGGGYVGRDGIPSYKVVRQWGRLRPAFTPRAGAGVVLVSGANDARGHSNPLRI